MTGNSATYDVADAGGASILQGGALTSISDSTFTGNQTPGYGGAIGTDNIGIAPTLTVTNCLFAGNSATQSGAINITPGAVLTMDDCTVSGNTALGGTDQGGAITTWGIATLVNSTSRTMSAGWAAPYPRTARRSTTL